MLHVLGAGLLLGTLLVVSQASHLFLGLCFHGSLLLSSSSVHFTVRHGIICILLGSLVHLALHRLVHILLAQALLLGLLVHDVALALRHDLIGALPRLINLLYHLPQSIRNG